MTTIAAVRWYLGDDVRTYLWPWENYIERACRSHLTAFVIAVVVRTFWDSGKSNTDDDPSDAVIKLADLLSGRSEQVVEPTQVEEDEARAGQSALPQSDVVAATQSNAGASVPPGDQHLGKRLLARSAARQKLVEAQQVIETKLRDLWEGVRTHAGISDAAMHPEDEAQRATVAALFAAFLKNPEMSNADVQDIVNPPVAIAKPQVAWGPKV